MTDPTPTRDEAVLITREMADAGAKAIADERKRVGLQYPDTLAVLAYQAMAPLAHAPAPASGGVDAATPSARWRAEGKPDPHGSRFDVERAKLIGGNLTDDEVAHQTAMLMRSDLNFEAVLAVARDRIRWLSRQLEASLSPAATPVSEAEPVAYTSPAQLREMERGTGGLTVAMWRERTRPEDVALYLAKPASSPAGGDVVREALEAYHDAYSDRRFAPEGSHEAYDAAARLEDAHDLASRALSQSTSAGRGNGGV